MVGKGPTPTLALPDGEARRHPGTRTRAGNQVFHADLHKLEGSPDHPFVVAEGTEQAKCREMPQLILPKIVGLSSAVLLGRSSKKAELQPLL